MILFITNVDTCPFCCERVKRQKVAYTPCCLCHSRWYGQQQQCDVCALISAARVYTSKKRAHTPTNTTNCSLTVTNAQRWVKPHSMLPSDYAHWELSGRDMLGVGMFFQYMCMYIYSLVLVDFDLLPLDMFCSAQTTAGTIKSHSNKFLSGLTLDDNVSL